MKRIENVRLIFDIKFVIYFMILLCPAGSSTYGINTGMGKISFFRFALIFAILISILVKSRVRVFNERNKYSVWFMFLWVGYAALSILWARELSSWMKSVFFILIGLVSIIIFENSLWNTKHYITAVKCYFAGVFLQSLIGWYETFTMRYHFISDLPENMYAYERYFLGHKLYTPIAMAGNPNDFASILFVGIILGYILICITDDVMKKMVLIMLEVLLFIQIILTDSRAGLAGVLLSAGFLVFMKSRNRGRAVLCFGFVMCCIVIMASVANGTVLLDFSNMNGSNSVRWNLIKNGLYFLSKTFGFGVGAGQINSWMKSDAKYYVSFYSDMHNWWMEILVAFGIVIFVLYMVFYLGLFFDTYKKYKIAKAGKKTGDSRFHENFSLGICAIMVGYVICGISASSNINSEYMWIMWAICIAYQGMDIHCLWKDNQ